MYQHLIFFCPNVGITRSFAAILNGPSPFLQKAFCSISTRRPMLSAKLRSMRFWPYSSRCLTKCAVTTASRGTSPNLNAILTAVGCMTSSNRTISSYPERAGKRGESKHFWSHKVSQKPMPRQPAILKQQHRGFLINTEISIGYPSRTSPIRLRPISIGNPPNSG